MAEVTREEADELINRPDGLYTLYAKTILPADDPGSIQRLGDEFNRLRRSGQDAPLRTFLTLKLAELGNVQGESLFPPQVTPKEEKPVEAEKTKRSEGLEKIATVMKRPQKGKKVSVDGDISE